MAACFKVTTAVMLLPLLASAQTPTAQPPPAVDQALRSRASEFLQDFVDGQYRKALKFVAEESQDFYFASSKAELKNFKIDNIKYDPDFQKATVYFTSDRTWKIHLEGVNEVPIQVQMSSTWKMEDGQWAWYYRPEGEPWITAMGPSNADLISKTPDGTVVVPKVINQDSADAAASKILNQTYVDKSKLAFPADKASSDKVVFHNGVNGQVAVELMDVPKMPGLSVKLAKDSVGFGEEAVVDVSYDPPADSDVALQLPPRSFGVTIHPFEQTFWVRIDFTAPPKQ